MDDSGVRMDEVKTWLLSIKLSQYSTDFERNGWDDMDIVQTMDEEDIKTCVTKPGHIKKIKLALQRLRQDDIQGKKHSQYNSKYSADNDDNKVESTINEDVNTAVRSTESSNDTSLLPNKQHCIDDAGDGSSDLTSLSYKHDRNEMLGDFDVTMDEVKTWLSSIKLSQYTTDFDRTGWDDMDTIQNMDEEDIKTCVAKPGHIKKIKLAIQRLCQDNKLCKQHPKCSTKYRADYDDDNRVQSTIHEDVNTTLRSAESSNGISVLPYEVRCIDAPADGSHLTPLSSKDDRNETQLECEEISYPMNTIENSPEEAEQIATSEECVFSELKNKTLNQSDQWSTRIYHTNDQQVQTDENNAKPGYACEKQVQTNKCNSFVCKISHQRFQTVTHATHSRSTQEVSVQTDELSVFESSNGISVLPYEVRCIDAPADGSHLTPLSSKDDRNETQLECEEISYPMNTIENSPEEAEQIATSEECVFSELKNKTLNQSDQWSTRIYHTNDQQVQTDENNAKPGYACEKQVQTNKCNSFVCKISHQRFQTVTHATHSRSTQEVSVQTDELSVCEEFNTDDSQHRQHDDNMRMMRKEVKLPTLSNANSQVSELVIPNENAVEQRNERAVELWKESAVEQSNENAVEQWNENAVDLSNKNAVEQWNESAVEQSNKNAVVQWNKDAVEQLNEDAVEQWNESAVEQSNKNAIEQKSQTVVCQTTAVASMSNISKTTVVKDSKHVTIADKIKQVVQGSRPGENYAAQVSTALRSYEKTKEPLFVTTKAYKMAYDFVEDQDWVTILGNHGDGKSMIADQLMLEYSRKGHQPVVVTSVDDWKLMVEGEGKTSHKQFVKINDIFGSTSADNLRVNEWLRLHELIQEVIKERRGDLKVVCTIRKVVYAEIVDKINHLKEFRSLYLVDMTETNTELTMEQKREMLTKYCSRKEEKNVFTEVLETECPIGFPLCVEKYFANAYNTPQGAAFFECPIPLLKPDLLCMSKNEKEKYCSLVLLAFSRNGINAKYQDKKLDLALKHALHVAGLPKETPRKNIMDALKLLNKVFVVKCANDTWEFKHKSIKDVVTILVTESDPIISLRYMDASFLMHNTKCEGYTIERGELVVVFPNTCYSALASRLTDDMHSENCSLVLQHQAWESTEFTQVWIKHVKKQRGALEKLTAMELNIRPDRLSLLAASINAGHTRITVAVLDELLNRNYHRDASNRLYLSKILRFTIALLQCVLNRGIGIGMRKQCIYSCPEFYMPLLLSLQFLIEVLLNQFRCATLKYVRRDTLNDDQDALETVYDCLKKTKQAFQLLIQKRQECNAFDNSGKTVILHYLEQLLSTFSSEFRYEEFSREIQHEICARYEHGQSRGMWRRLIFPF